ncbi:MAG TPA: DUF2090 domain-containing protein, partial [Burkholderiaceae bacterium]
ELIPPRDVNSPSSPDDAVLRAVKRFYNLGFKPEWWKLAPMASPSWALLAALIAERDPPCRGVVILGLNQPLDVLVQGFQQATHPIVKGFMVGRTLWAGPSLRWLKGEIDDDALIDEAARNFATLVEAWRASRPAAAHGTRNGPGNDPETRLEHMA